LLCSPGVDALQAAVDGIGFFPSQEDQVAELADLFRDLAALFVDFLAGELFGGFEGLLKGVLALDTTEFFGEGIGLLALQNLRTPLSTTLLLGDLGWCEVAGDGVAGNH